MLASGTVFPLSAVPQPWRDALMLNPVAHGIEGVRAGISAYYHHAPELSLGYLHGFALGLLFLGLALQRRFRHRLVSL
jgi:capsular polysaccharide transport system permease protein